MIENGNQVSIEYTLILNDGTHVDSNVGGKPLTYEHGTGQILPALEQALTGLEVNETKEVTISPEDGYGTVNPEAYEKVDPELIPEPARVAGTTLVAEDQSGNQRPIRVHEVHDDHIVLDFNHPLAGQTLQFSVKILAIE